MSDDAGHLPPVNHDAERAVLAAILMNNAVYDKVSDFLAPEHFADELNGRIFEHCRHLIDAGHPATSAILKHKLDADQDFADVGGSKYLQTINGAYVEVNVGHYGQVIRDLHDRRAVMAICDDYRRRATVFDVDLTAAEIVEDMEVRLCALMETGRPNGGARPLHAHLQEALSAVEQAQRGGRGVTGLPTGFAELDEATGGLQPGHTYVLAAQTSIGKTSFASCLTLNAAPHSDGAMLMFSLEMGGAQVATRLLSQASGISLHRLNRGRFEGRAWEADILPANERLAKLRVHLDDTPSISLPAIRSQARRIKRRHGLGLVVVDYLQLVQPPRERYGTRNDAVAAISRGLKALAVELDVPVVVLSQLSRKVEDREDRRPRLADLRDSGTIEQDADVVAFLYREERHIQANEPHRRENETETNFSKRYMEWSERLEKARGKAELILAKNRNGPLTTIELRFDPKLMTFAEPRDEAASLLTGGEL